jgi:predicted nucleotide-binding protein (sugar kinase/HSP70/actin superfamily)
VAIDLLEKKLLETRAYERHQGNADEVYQHYLHQVHETLRDRGDLEQVLREARGTFDDVALNGRGDKPIVGVVGEIYVRSNRFSNENTVRHIEALGAEAWLPPISEWLLYVNFTSKRQAKTFRRYRHLLQILIKEWVQRKDEHHLMHLFEGSIRNLHEPAIPETLALAQGYLHDSFEGEAILSIGKSRDFVQKGVSGLVNIMPFTCMPGTVVNSLFNRFREEHDNIPFLALAYDGQEQTHTLTRLEAFMYQVRQFQKRRRQ